MKSKLIVITFFLLISKFISAQHLPFVQNIELATIDLTGEGVTFTGRVEEEVSGYSVSSIGDINDDGIDDFTVSADWASVNGELSGSVYTIYGRTYGFPRVMYASNINGHNGFVIHGLNAYDQLGFSVSVAGDVDNWDWAYGIGLKLGLVIQYTEDTMFPDENGCNRRCNRAF
ncbi:MAG: hypothetical protein ACSHWU_02085 [Marinicella sp.]